MIQGSEQSVNFKTFLFRLFSLFSSFSIQSNYFYVIGVWSRKECLKGDEYDVMVHMAMPEESAELPARSDVSAFWEVEF